MRAIPHNIYCLVFRDHDHLYLPKTCSYNIFQMPEAKDNLFYIYMSCITTLYRSQLHTCLYTVTMFNRQILSKFGRKTARSDPAAPKHRKTIQQLEQIPKLPYSLLTGFPKLLTQAQLSASIKSWHINRMECGKRSTPLSSEESM